MDDRETLSGTSEHGEWSVTLEEGGDWSATLTAHDGRLGDLYVVVEAIPSKDGALAIAEDLRLVNGVRAIVFGCPHEWRTWTRVRINPATRTSIEARGRAAARAHMDTPGDELEDLVRDLEVECAGDHGFSPSDNERAALAACALFRVAFLEARVDALEAAT